MPPVRQVDSQESLNGSRHTPEIFFSPASGFFFCSQKVVKRILTKSPGPITTDSTKYCWVTNLISQHFHSPHRQICCQFSECLVFASIQEYFEKETTTTAVIGLV